uniref:Reverse transcriptase domain-containing protein n=1 Tax=Tanacetum cinerariifolium TaxID=118510 RepID=A0A6L2P530_TANCI|nr:reverse transcriptase domain-containing protein [Tanacetum cinerariifolium]
MSSPKHPTSNIEDAFSSNSPDYTQGSPDYFSASPGNTSPDPLNDLTKDPLASLTFPHFHDDPYMKVMQAYYAKESPIPPPAPIAPPIILPPSPMLSPLLNSQDFFRPEEILPPKKRARGRSSSSTSALPQEFEIEESSRLTRLERHEEQIEEILNHLDELSLDRIEHMENKIEGHDDEIALSHVRTSTLEMITEDIQRSTSAASTSEAPVMTQASIRKLVTDSVTTALETQATTMTRAVGLIRWFKQTESVFSHSNCAKENKVTFATGTLTDDAFSWWNAYAQPIGIEQANKTTWTELKMILTNKYCPQNEVKKMEDEFYNMIVKGNDLKTYVRRFQELAVLCPNMVPNTEKLMEVFIKGLPQSIEGTVTASKPQTLEEATNIGQRLMDQIIKRGSMQETSDHKPKFDDRRNSNNNNNNNPNNRINNYQNNRNNNSNHNNDYH